MGVSRVELLSFLKKHFIHWLEAMSILGKVSEAMRAIKALESLFAVGIGTVLVAIVY